MKDSGNLDKRGRQLEVNIADYDLSYSNHLNCRYVVTAQSSPRELRRAPHATVILVTILCTNLVGSSGPYVSV